MMKGKAMKRRIHITAVGSPARAELERLTSGLTETHPPRPSTAKKHQASNDVLISNLVSLAQQAVGGEYRVTINAGLLTAREDDKAGGRDDDRARATEVESVLADDTVAAMVTIRGGAWFVRLLDLIDFDVLKRRKTPVYIFGFSEMTPLIAIAGQYSKAIALYDLGPGFLYAGVKRHVQMNIARYAKGIDLPPEQHEAFAAGWAMSRFRSGMAEFFSEVTGVIEGRACPRVPTGRLLTGSLPARSTIRIVGGNLSLTAPMMGTRFASAFDTTDKWLALEDLNEMPEQCDRMIAGLKHNGLLERAEGIILGDFHNKDGEFIDAVVKLLKHHLPARKKTPVIQLDNFGHIWPLAPLPMHREVTLRCSGHKAGSLVEIEIPWAKWAQ